MAATKTKPKPTKPPARKAPAPAPAGEPDPRLAELARITDELEAAEQDATGWREKRNKEVARLRRLADPPTTTAIADVARIRHSFVTRIVKGRGRPASGHDQPAAKVDGKAA